MKRVLLAVLFASAVAAPAAAWASPEDGRDPGARGDRRGRVERALRHRAHARRAMRLLRRLELTDAQREGIRDARKAATDVRKDLREKVRSLFQDARAKERTPESRAELREKVKAAIEEARGKVEPQAKAILDSLTSEQRAKLLEAAARRRGTATDADLVRGISRLLLAPRDRHRR
jgi:Spy/CpxP family protein refolding chaperone